MAADWHQTGYTPLAGRTIAADWVEQAEWLTGDRPQVTGYTMHRRRPGYRTSKSR